MIQGFRKVDPDRWEFANEGFLRGRKQLLKKIHRRKSMTQLQARQQIHATSLGPCVELGQYGIEGEIEMLTRDKHALMVEAMRLRQQQQCIDRELQTMGRQLQATERRQEQMVSFLAKAIQSPGGLAQLMQQSDPRIADSGRKRRLLEGEEPGAGEFSEEGPLVTCQAGSLDHLSSTFVQILGTDCSMQEKWGTKSLDAMLQEVGSPSELPRQGIGDMGKGMPDPIVREITSQGAGHLPLKVEHSIGHRGSSEDEYIVSIPENLQQFEMDFDAELEGDEAVSGRIVLDLFWEEFLGSKTQNLDTGKEAAQHKFEGDAPMQLDVTADAPWWSFRADTDDLAKHLGPDG